MRRDMESVCFEGMYENLPTLFKKTLNPQIPKICVSKQVEHGFCSFAGQGKQSASRPKAKGNCRRLCPPTATVSIETRPLLQKPFTSVHTSPRPLPMHANDER